VGPSGRYSVILGPVIIKVLYVILVLSAAMLIGVAVAVSARIRWHLKSRRAPAGASPEGTQESGQERFPPPS